MDEVVKRDDIFYRKFSNIPLTGHIESYHPNGQLKIAGAWKDGLRDGKWEYYMENGNKEVFVLYSKGREWMVLDFDRFGVPKNNDDVKKFDDMLKNKDDLEAGETKKGKRKLKRSKRKEEKKKKKEAKKKAKEQAANENTKKEKDE